MAETFFENRADKTGGTNINTIYETNKDKVTIFGTKKARRKPNEPKIPVKILAYNNCFLGSVLLSLNIAL